MKKIFFLLILLIPTTSVNAETCGDYSDKEIFQYSVEYGNYPAPCPECDDPKFHVGKEWYKIVDTPTTFGETVSNPYGYLTGETQDYWDYYESSKNSIKIKEGVNRFVSDSGVTSTSLNDAAANLATQEQFIDSFIADEKCEPGYEEEVVEEEVVEEKVGDEITLYQDPETGMYGVPEAENAELLEVKCGWLAKYFGYCEEPKKEKIRKDKGSMTFKKGRVLIERGIDIIPGGIGVIVKAGDTIIVEEGAEVSIDLNDSGLLKISQKSKFTIPYAEHVTPKKIFYSNMYVNFKRFLIGEHFEIKVPGGGPGVRG